MLGTDAAVVVGEGLPMRRLTSSLFFVGETAGAAAASAGMEKPTIEDVGSAFFAGPVVVEEPAGRRSEAHDFLTAGAAGAGAGTGAGGVGVNSVVGSGVVSWVETATGSSGAGTGTSSAGGGVGSTTDGAGATASSLGADATFEVETEVLVVAGDPGTVGVSAFSVTADEGTVEFACE